MTGKMETDSLFISPLNKEECHDKQIMYPHIFLNTGIWFNTF